MLGGVGGRPADHGQAVLAQVVARLLLRRVEVPGRDDVGAAALQHEQQRRGLRLQVDAGADAEAGEGPRLLELGAGQRQQPAALADPFEAQPPSARGR